MHLCSTCGKENKRAPGLPKVGYKDPFPFPTTYSTWHWFGIWLAFGWHLGTSRWLSVGQLLKPE